MATKNNALISVSDKTGLLDLAKGLQKIGIQLVASGGTARNLRDAGFVVTEVADLTGFPEILGGRVKTLHPAVHGGILARDTEADNADLTKHGIGKIDYVICNLYPFKSTVSKAGVTVPEAVEEIDIGGVTLLRAAAKNHSRVTVVSNPEDYPDFLQELDRDSTISEAIRQKYALKAFEHTAEYDTSISDYFRKEYARDSRIALRYGINPHQKPAEAFIVSESKLPFKAINGAPGYINLLDMLNAWQLVRELRKALGLCAAASFKHVSPAGAACYVPLSDVEKQVFFVDDLAGIETSQLATAYARARGSDRMASFGDVIALSDEVDLVTAKLISREVSDGVIAPSYSPAALEILAKKKGGKYLVMQIDPEYEPSGADMRTVFGVTLKQDRNNAVISKDSFNAVLSCKGKLPLPDAALRDLVVATISAKYTQSNTVVYAWNGQTIGVGAGQQSRIGCTRLAGQKSDDFYMRYHPRCLSLKFKQKLSRPTRTNAIDVLCGGLVPESGPEKDDFESRFEEVPQLFTQKERVEWLKNISNVAMSSDAFFPFDDSILRASRSGVKYIAAPLGSNNDSICISTAEKLGITMIEQPTRLFHH